MLEDILIALMRASTQFTEKVINFTWGDRESRGQWEGFHLGESEYLLTRQTRKGPSGRGRSGGKEAKRLKGILH